MKVLLRRSPLHCNDIGLASFLCLLILDTPTSDSITHMRAFVLYLGVIAHTEIERVEKNDKQQQENERMYV